MSLSTFAAAWVIAVSVVVLGGPTGTAQDIYAPIKVVPRGAVEGGDALYMPHGDILNVRNIQGGLSYQPNLDIGAGSSEHRGDIALNYDVGNRVLIFDGRKRLVAKFGPRGIVFYKRPRYRGP